MIADVNIALRIFVLIAQNHISWSNASFVKHKNAIYLLLTPNVVNNKPVQGVIPNALHAKW